MNYPLTGSLRHCCALLGVGLLLSKPATFQTLSFTDVTEGPIGRPLAGGTAGSIAFGDYKLIQWIQWLIPSCLMLNPIEHSC